MRRLLVCSLALGLFLLQACSDNGDQASPSSTAVPSTSGAISPTAVPSASGVTSPTAAPETSGMTADEVIAFAQAYSVSYRVHRPDGLWEVAVVPLASRVDTFCADIPVWRAEESEDGNWRIFARCQKEQSVPVDSNPLIFEFLYYPGVDLVAPWNHPAHVAHADYPWLP